MTKKDGISSKPQNKSYDLTCGIIMPIASMADYSSSHWQDIKSIIKESTNLIDNYNFTTEIVSDSDGEVNIIHKNIIWNIYNADIVVCDISGRNPNVLFELGMRLTFDKPTVIIKDKETPFMFDTGSIETLEYPKDLRFGDIVNFKSKLAKKIQLTYEKSVEDLSYSTFLGHFGEFKVPALNQKAVTEPQEIILTELGNIRDEISKFKKEFSLNSQTRTRNMPMSSKISANPPLSAYKSSTVELVYRELKDYFINTRDFRDPVDIANDYRFINDFKETISPIHLETIPFNVFLEQIKDAQSATLKK